MELHNLASKGCHQYMIVVDPVKYKEEASIAGIFLQVDTISIFLSGV